MSPMFQRFRRVLGGTLAAAMLATAIPAAPAAAATASSSTVTKRYASADNADGASRNAYGAKARIASKRVVVRWASGVPKTQIAAAATSIGFKVDDSGVFGYTLVEPTKAGLTSTQLIAKLRAAHLVTRASVSRMYQADSTPTDPLFGQQWGLENVGQDGGTAGASIDVTPTWSRSTGSTDVVVAVVDTGIDINHPDLKANIWTNPGEIPNNGVDDDHNGYVDDVHGYDFANADETVYDEEEGDLHGTHVAGIIGAEGDNGIGVAGVNWHVTIMPVKGLYGFGDGDDYSLAEAVEYAVDNGADVVNCSWGGGYSDVLKEAFDYAAAHGVFCAVAAGNDSWNNDDESWASYPASFESTTIVSVAATDRNDKLAWFSNYGQESVDLAAPGVDVTSTLAPELLGVFADRPGYKAVYLAFAPEILEPTGVGKKIVQRSMTKLSTALDAPVLVVDDSAPKMTGETPGQRLSVYTDALADAGYSNVTTYSTEAMGSLTAADLYGKTVVWFTGKTTWGWYDDWALSQDDRDAISGFLDGGGRLLLASGDAATEDLWIDEMASESDEWLPSDDESDWEPPLIEKYFGAYATDYSPWSNQVNGVAGSGYDEVTATIPASYMDEYDENYDWPTAADPIYSYETWAKPLFRTGEYATLSGTSMATPHVAGAAALIKSENPTATAQDIIDRMASTVHHTPELEAKTAWGGRLDVSAAASDYPKKPTIVSPKTGTTISSGTSTTISWTPARGTEDATFEVQAGLPKVVLDQGFEDGTIGAFSSETTVGWEVTTDPESVHSGSYALRSGNLEPALLPLYPDESSDIWGLDGNVSAVDTTVTVGEGGAQLSFYWWWEADWWNTSCVFLVDGQVVEWPEYSFRWSQVKTALTPGEHRLEWMYVKWDAPAAGRDGMGIDDLRLTALDFQPVATTAPGATSAEWAAPDTDVAGAAVRVRANTGDYSSAWSYSRKLRIGTDTVAPEAPTPTLSQSGDGTVTVGWTAPSDADLASLRIERTPGDNGAASKVSYEGTQSGTFTDGPMKAGTVVTYTAYAEDAVGNVSQSSVTTTVVDAVAPTTPANLSAQLIDDVVALGWQAPRPGAYAGMKVLRRTDRMPTGVDDPDAELVYDGVSSEAWDYALTERPVRLTGYYAVYAYDASGNLSQPATTTIKVDTIGPRGTMNLNKDADYVTSSTVTVYNNVLGATEMRFDTGSGYSDTWLPFATTTKLKLLDIEGPQFVDAQYRDAKGRVLELEDDIYVNLHAPAAPTNVAATAWSDTVKLTWDPSEELDVESYNVYMSTTPGGMPSLIKGGVSSPGCYIGTLSDGYTRLTPGKTYYFKVQAVDGSNLKSKLSSEASGTPKTGAVTRNVGSKYTLMYKASAQFSQVTTAVVASGDAYADALTASSLAGAYDSPLFLIPKAGLTSSAATKLVTELHRLGVKAVVPVGRSDVLPSSALTTLGKSFTVTSRIQGSTNDRYSLSGRVAQEVMKVTGDDFAQTVFLVNGSNMGDAMAASAYAFSQKIPFIFVNPSYPTHVYLPKDVKAKTETAYVLGSSKLVSSTTLKAYAFPIAAERIYGYSKYGTAEALAEFAQEQGWVGSSRIAIAGTTDSYSPLLAGIAEGDANVAVLLTGPYSFSEESSEYFYSYGDQVQYVDGWFPSYSTSYTYGPAMSECLYMRDEIANMMLEDGGDEEYPDDWGPWGPDEEYGLIPSWLQVR